MDVAANNRLFTHLLPIDRDKAIAFLKSVGYEETPETGVFSRDTERSAAQQKAGARALTLVNVDRLIASRRNWRQFVWRWTRKLAGKQAP